jgi:hypothetical protein
MKSQKYSVAVGAVALVTTLAMSVASGASVPSTPRAAAHTVTSHTATHTLICYKGKLITPRRLDHQKARAGQDRRILWFLHRHDVAAVECE